jgi:hypothetical protein
VNWRPLRVGGKSSPLHLFAEAELTVSLVCTTTEGFLVQNRADKRNSATRIVSLDQTNVDFT